MKPLLYSGTKNASSWAMRAWLALREAGVVFEEEVVDIRRPQRFANLDRIGAFSPPAMVPALVVDQTVIFDSVAIMEYANEVADGVLLPEDRAARARARSLMAWQHSGLSGICALISFERLSLADLMLVPTVVRLTRHDLDLASWPLSRNWSADLLDRVSVAEWMREADTLPHIWFDDYLVPGDPVRMRAA